MIILVLVISCVVFLYFHSRRLNYWKIKGVPTASQRHWFFGHFKPLLTSKKHIGHVFQDIYKEYPDSSYVGYMKMRTPCLAIRDPDLIKSVLSTDFNSFSENEFKVDKKHDFLMGNSPFVLKGEEWKTVRGHATPLITLAKLNAYLPTMQGVCNEMVQYLKNATEEKGLVELELKNFSGKYTTDIIANAILGVANNTFVDENSTFARITKELFAFGIINNLKFFGAMIYPELAPYLRIRFASKEIEDALLELTHSRMQETFKDGEFRYDIFQQMKLYREKDTTGVFTDKYIASHCFAFMTDGYETSSDLMSFILYELAWHTEIQDKLRDEIVDMISETKNAYNVEHLEKMKYLDMVVSETLRIYPPAATISKICTEDYKVASTGLLIEKNTPITIPILALHLDEKYYPNVEKFDPERFSEEAAAKRHRYVYLPFGEGPRKCFGQRFGLFQVKLAVVTILQHFKLRPSAKTNYPVELDPTFFISRPMNGAYVHFEYIRK